MCFPVKLDGDAGTKLHVWPPRALGIPTPEC